MAETKPTATATAPATAVRSTTSVQPVKKGNSISWLAPLTCVILGYIIWRFVIGNPSNFTAPDPAGGFWPNHQGAKGNFPRMYLGGIIVPLLIGTLQYHLANRDVDKAMAECDRQKGSVGNVMKAGLRKYKEMISNTELTTD